MLDLACGTGAIVARIKLLYFLGYKVIHGQEKMMDYPPEYVHTGERYRCGQNRKDRVTLTCYWRGLSWADAVLAFMGIQGSEP